MARCKRPLIVATLLIGWCVLVWTQDPSIALDLRLARLDGAIAPEMVDNDVLLTYASDRRVHHVGAAFAHENFRTVHTFYRWRPFNAQRPHTDGDLFFLAYPVPPGVERLEYRLVVDGVWMADPANPAARRDRDGTRLSLFEVPQPARPRPATPVAVAERRGVMRFVFEPGDPALGELESIHGRPAFLAHNRGLDVRVAGTFNRWDPFLHPLREDPARPGRYVADIPVARGRHNYYFVVDGRRLVDPHNPHRRYHRDGYAVSTFVVP